MKVNILIGLVVLFGISSCSKEETPPPEPTILYDISGSVNLYNEGTTQQSGSGMVVTVLGTDPIIFDETDVDGKFSLQEVEKGTYTLSFEKSGFGTFKLFDIEHTGNEPTIITSSPSLGEKSTTSVSILIARVTNDTLELNTSLKQNANIDNPRYVRVLFGKNSDLSAEKYDYYFPVYVKEINPFTIKYSSAELIAMGFQKGDKVYVNVAGDSFFSNDYDDPELERQIFPNLFWTAGVDDFIVP